MLSLVCIGCVWSLTAHNMYKHLVHYAKPHLQTHILRILLITPIVVFFSFLALLFPDGRYPISVLRDFWEAVVIYSFLMLVLEYMGGEHLCLSAMVENQESGKSPELHYPFPFSYCFGKSIPTEQLVRLPKRCALQFVFVKPVMCIVELLLYAQGKEREVVAILFVNLVYNVSYSVALFGLYLIYTASKNHVAMQDKNAVLKFAAVKMVVFLTFWQSYLFPLLIHSEHQESWQDFILIIECAFFTACMTLAFNWREFSNAAPVVKEYNSPKDTTPGGRAVPRTPAGQGVQGQYPGTSEAAGLEGVRVVEDLANQLAGRGDGGGNEQAGGSSSSTAAHATPAKKMNYNAYGAETVRGTPVLPSSQYDHRGSRTADGVVAPTTGYPVGNPAHHVSPNKIGSARGTMVQLDMFEIEHIGQSSSHDDDDANGSAAGTFVGASASQIESPGKSTTKFGRAKPKTGDSNRSSPRKRIDDVNLSDSTGDAQLPPISEATSGGVSRSGGAGPDPRDQQEGSGIPPGPPGSARNSSSSTTTASPSKGGTATGENAKSGGLANTKERKWLQNARQTFHPKDIINDAKRSFSARYNNHVMLEMDAQEHAYADVQKKDALKAQRENEKEKKANAAAVEASMMHFASFEEVNFPGGNGGDGGNEGDGGDHDPHGEFTIPTPTREAFEIPAGETRDVRFDVLDQLGPGGEGEGDAGPEDGKLEEREPDEASATKSKDDEDVAGAKNLGMSEDERTTKSSSKEDDHALGDGI